LDGGMGVLLMAQCAKRCTDHCNAAHTIGAGKVNRLVLTAADGGNYLVSLALVRSRSHQEVKALMLPPESLSAAVARVLKQVCCRRA
jgi:hypothetical protein